MVALVAAGCGSQSGSGAGNRSVGASGHAPTAGRPSSTTTATSASTVATPTWITLPDSNPADNQSNGVALLIESSGGPLDVYGLTPGGFTTQLTLSIPGAQIAYTAGSAQPPSETVGTFPVLTAPTATHPYGTVVVVASGTVTQQGLTPASTIEALQVYDPRTGSRLSSIPLHLPPSASQFEPEQVTSTAVAGMLTEQDSSGHTTGFVPAGFSLADAHLLWSGQPVPASAGSNGGLLFVYPDNSGQVNISGGPSGTDESSCQIRAIDATSGRVLYTVSTATFGSTDPSQCFDQQVPASPYGPSNITAVRYGVPTPDPATTGCGSWLFDTRTGAPLPSPPVAPGTCSSSYDETTGLVAIQELGTSPDLTSPTGPVVVFRPGTNTVVRTLNQQTVSGVGFSLVSACDGQLLGTTSSQDLTVDEATGKTTTLSWKAAPTDCGHGWALAEGLATTGNNPEYLYRGAPPVLQELAGEP